MGDEMFFLKNAYNELSLYGTYEKVYVRSPSGTAAEKWIRKGLGDGVFTLENLYTRQRLHERDYDDVIMSPRDDDDEGQQWTFEDECWRERNPVTTTR